MNDSWVNCIEQLSAFINESSFFFNRKPVRTLSNDFNCHSELLHFCLFFQIWTPIRGLLHPFRLGMTPESLQAWHLSLERWFGLNFNIFNMTLISWREQETFISCLYFKDNQLQCIPFPQRLNWTTTDKTNEKQSNMERLHAENTL